MARKKDEAGTWSYLLREGLAAMSLGWELALPIFAGVLAGYYLDRWLGTGHIFTIGLLMAGIATGFYTVGRFIQRMARRDQKAAQEQEAEDEP